MGFWDNVGSVLSKVAETVEKSAEKEQCRKERAVKSAIKSGRMHKTNNIKGCESKIPQKPGMYRHVNKETGEVEYVGQTDNLRRRQQQHARDGKLDTAKQDVMYSVARNEATKDDLCDTEKAHIKRKKPSGNTTIGGNGKR